MIDVWVDYIMSCDDHSFHAKRFWKVLSMYLVYTGS